MSPSLAQTMNLKQVQGESLNFLDGKFTEGEKGKEFMTRNASEK